MLALKGGGTDKSTSWVSTSRVVTAASFYCWTESVMVDESFCKPVTEEIVQSQDGHYEYNIQKV
jgi:hypothetical protein